MFIGYVRVSKSDGSQSVDLQKDALIEFGIDPDRIYEDLATGRHDDRPGLKACLKALQPGNTLVVWKLDRLGRSLKDLINIVDGLGERGISFKVISGMGSNIDTTSSQGKLFFSVFAALAEYERDLIVERTQAGLAAARARGRAGGRPKKMDPMKLKMAMNAMRDREVSAQEVAKQLNISTPTLYYYVNGDGTPKEAGSRVLSSEQPLPG